MAARGHRQPSFEGRAAQAPGMMRHGPFPGSGHTVGHRSLETAPHPDIAENKMLAQVAEIERLAGDNHRLAATHGALRQELVAAQHEISRIKAQIRSIETESDIQIRVLMERIAKMEGDIRAGEHVKKELQQAHIEAQSLVTARQELTTQVQQATQELQKANADVKRLPELHAELDSMGQEHQRLRSTFEYEKGLNVDQVREMQEMEKNLVVMAREVEKLRAEVLNAEKRAHAPNPYSGSYPEPSYPPPTQGSGAYIDSYGRPHAQMIAGTPSAGMIPYGSVAIPPASSGAAWGGAYDPNSHTQH
ncbi:hypothetical protein AAG906_026653 [Vitis piasezkii]